jgi:hypothetical protein
LEYIKICQFEKCGILHEIPETIGNCKLALGLIKEFPSLEKFQVKPKTHPKHRNKLFFSHTKNLNSSAIPGLTAGLAVPT